VVLATAGLLAGCTVGPSSRPPLATYGEQPTAPTSATVSARPTGPGGAGRESDPLSWGSCPSGLATESQDGTTFTLECAELSVPQSYSDNAGRSLNLAVVRARSGSTPADAPNLVLVTGSPGANGTAQIAELAGSLPEQLRAGHAIVTVDLRGTLPTNPRMDCFRSTTVQQLLAPPTDPTDPGQAADVGTLSTAMTYDCGDEVGTAISDFSTMNSADDLDTLRAALGQDRLQFVGQGFGATLGAVYADRYPGRVQRLVLDAPTDPQATLSDLALARATALESALDDFADECKADSCALGADPKKAVTDLIAGLGESGRPAARMLVTDGSVLLLLSHELGDPSGWPELAKALAAADGGDGDLRPMLNLLEHDLGLDDDRHLLESHIAYTCNDAQQRLSGAALASSAAAAKQKSPVFGAFMIAQAGLCSDWPTAVRPLARVTGAGAPPILVAGSTADPISPYSGVQSVVAQLSSAQLISWQSGAHGSFPASRCISGAVVTYLDNGTPPAVGRLCPP
jgi:pimeloyl-ACP methyl ester carboxylesterase